MSSTATALMVVGIIGNLCSFALFLVPMITFRKVIMRKSVGDYSGTPYVTTLLNCLLWVFYGSSAVTNTTLIISINGAGLALEAIYISIHLLYGTDESRKKVGGGTFFVIVTFVLMAICVMWKVALENRVLVVGSICVVVNILMYASPLTAMRNVIKSKSVVSMPIGLSVASFFNGLIWTAYGGIKGDKFILIPNGLGLVFCISQFVLYGCYYSSHSDGRVIPPTRRRPSDEGGFDAMPSKDFTILHNNIRVIRSIKSHN
ncbi:unnamed protein product [Sphagnum troendelagicum]|uniref:Bidirectional sugar transporter SWEET n=1 Tax=Sphagnum troendelagicum TaxID=128251 RepID=A0ABP0TVS4_9BRYO